MDRKTVNGTVVGSFYNAVYGHQMQVRPNGGEVITGSPPNRRHIKVGDEVTFTATFVSAKRFKNPRGFVINGAGRGF